MFMFRSERKVGVYSVALALQDVLKGIKKKPPENGWSIANNILKELILWDMLYSKIFINCLNTILSIVYTFYVTFCTPYSCKFKENVMLMFKLYSF